MISRPVPNESAWPQLAREIHDSSGPVRVLPVDPRRGVVVLEELGVTERSTLGALVANTGGLIVDHGWLRILAGGFGALPDVAEASRVRTGAPPFLTVAQDVLGGRFAIDGGGLGVAPGEVCFWGPDTLHWTGIGGGHLAFISWALTGGLSEFYAELRWVGWEQETSNLPLDYGISVYPPPFAEEGRDLGAASRRSVPYPELINFYADMARQLEAVEDGTRVRLTVCEDTDTAAQPDD